MIEVSVQERGRTFEVRIGEKDVGRLVSYGHGVFIYRRDPEGRDDYDHLGPGWRYVTDAPSLRRAARELLAREGYGRRARPIVRRRTGIRA